ncbi:MAG: UbiD family decarboxylase [Rhodospirillales bacterium]|jgi:4-hydroxy-3-polyprenylbenzoate decarboxylase|nr:UbiD family decarboxylase [Rhodospirillales bacterium]MBT4007399.1 UbiD family decarboxylase [Rhodospirillales bacterium]MBT5076415.1 UbiD family decarboxylase [Rhodospirillales bacterium]MBT5112426.1 UbiD family decarboxylase [Rhodospirillales bacterium]MBT5673214.1 UbiD family decarboxylase [Rhodospirillales bacterium]
MANAFPKRGYRDLQEHLKALDEAGLLVTIDEPVNKDTELHPLVRWQYRGGIPDAERKAFLFTNVTDARGRKFDIPVVVGALAGNQEIYRIGMNVPLEEIGPTWERAMNAPIPPNVVEEAPCQETVITGADLIGENKGLDALPVPISTPGYDATAYFTATNVVTRDPDTGVQNMGTYRAGLKASNRLAVRMASRTGGAGGYLHWVKYQKRGDKTMPCAIVVGAPPAVAYLGPQKLSPDRDEAEVAGALMGAPINMVKCKTNDLMVPAEAEMVIEGLVDTEYLEPEAPFGESHGHIALEDYNMIFEVTAITMKKKPVLVSIISQVTPSESSVIKRVAYEPMFLAHLRDNLGIRGIKRVSLHEPLTNIRKVIFIVVEKGIPATEVWRALYGAASLRADCGKYVIAVNDDIDPENGDSIFWALAYRANVLSDVEILHHRPRGHGPKSGNVTQDGSLLIDATSKGDMPPLALPKREFMENAKVLWEKLGLPPIKEQSPWHGYDMGDWFEAWDENARRAVEGDYAENGRRTAQRRVKDVIPETPVRTVEGDPEL